MIRFLKDLGYRAILLPTPIQIYTKYIRYFAHKSPRAYCTCVTRISHHEDENICIARLNPRAGYATVGIGIPDVVVLTGEHFEIFA